jgi:hypothetical protein
MILYYGSKVNKESGGPSPSHAAGSSGNVSFSGIDSCPGCDVPVGLNGLITDPLAAKEVWNRRTFLLWL